LNTIKLVIMSIVFSIGFGTVFFEKAIAKSNQRRVSSVNMAKYKEERHLTRKKVRSTTGKSKKRNRSRRATTSRVLKLKGVSRSPLPSTGQPLEVRGQGRALNMLLVLKSKKDEVDFVNIKNHYLEEILGTNF